MGFLSILLPGKYFELVFILPAGQYFRLVLILPAGQYFLIVLILPAGIYVLHIGIHFTHCTLFPITTDLCKMDDISKLNI